MLQCIDCKVFFFGEDGLNEHKNKWCIGYKPLEVVHGKRKSKVFM
jgi:hypothetical protein